MKRKKGYSKTLLYNRASKGYRKNMAKGIMNTLDIKSPDKSKITNLVKVSGYLLVIWAIMTVIVVITKGLRWLFLSLLVAVIYGIYVYKRIDKYQRDLIKCYISMQVPKDRFLDDMASQRMKAGALKRLSKTWDRILNGRPPMMKITKAAIILTAVGLISLPTFLLVETHTIRGDVYVLLMLLLLLAGIVCFCIAGIIKLKQAIKGK